jgi:hypothetical protein
MAWDRDRNGAYIFVTPAASASTAGTHLWFDAATGGLWPIQFPCTARSPRSSTTATTPTTGRSSWAAGTATSARWTSRPQSDDGTAISSYLYLGPVKANEITESVMEWVDVLLGESARHLGHGNAPERPYSGACY